jgi:hypothetical protein
VSAAQGGGLFQQTLNYDVGQPYATSFTQYDPLAHNAFSSYQNLYNAAGQVAQQFGTYDSGPEAGRRWNSVYDTADASSYSQFTQVYNASNQVLYQTGTYDHPPATGWHHWTTTYTTPGDVSHYTQDIYNAAGGVVAHFVV